ncbi:hypothetical protein AURDEDRAFT_172675 [Auricularia subglabra TFB-10046 SS5]|nr:hypothetical protein AURDEDRAFT_172675 [Auricularia subglabra TFB-10046 SS5]
MSSDSSQVIRLEFPGGIVELTVPHGSAARCLVSVGVQTDGITTSEPAALPTESLVPQAAMHPQLPTEMYHIASYKTQEVQIDNAASIRGASPLFTKATASNKSTSLFLLPPVSDAPSASLPTQPSTGRLGKRKFVIAASTVGDTSAPDSKRAKQSLPTTPAKPRPFPMDIPRELAFRAKLQADKLNDPLPKNPPPPPAPDRTRTNIGDFVLLQVNSNGLFYPYEACERGPSGFKLRVYKGIASSVPPPVIQKSFFNIMMAEDKSLKCHEVVKLYWPACDIPNTDDEPALPDWYSDYKAYIVQHLVGTPTNSPFKSLMNEWSMFINRTRHAKSDDHFNFTQAAMLSSTRLHVNTVLSFSDQQRVERAGEELLNDLLVAESYTRSLIPSLVSGPGSIILSFAQLAFNLNLTIPQTVTHFIAGHVVQADRRRERVWGCYLHHLEHGRMVEEEIKTRVLVAHPAVEFVHIVD